MGAPKVTIEMKSILSLIEGGETTELEDPGKGVGLEVVELVIIRQVNHSEVQVVVECRNLHLAGGERKITN